MALALTGTGTDTGSGGAPSTAKAGTVRTSQVIYHEGPPQKRNLANGAGTRYPVD